MLYSLSIVFFLLVVILLNHQSDSFGHIGHMLLIFFLGLLIIGGLTKNIYYCKRNILVFVVFFIFIFVNMLISSIFFDNVPNSYVTGLFNKIIAMLIFIGLLLFIYINFKIDSNALLKYALIFFITVAIVSGLSAVQEFFTGTALLGPLFIPEARHPDIRLSGFFYNPNELGFVLIVGALSVFHLLFHSKNKWTTLVYGLLLLFLLLMIVGSGSKKAIFGFLVSIFFYSFLYIFFINKTTQLKRYIVKSSIYLIIFFSIIVYLLFAVIGFDEFFTFIGSDVNKLSTLTGRSDIWQNVPVILQDASIYEIIWGHGNDYFLYYTTRSAHNGYIQIFIDYGIMVLSCLLFFIISVATLYFMNSFKLMTYDSVIALVILFYICMSSIAESTMLNGKNSSYYMILILFIMMLPQKISKENKNENIIPIK